MKDDRNGSNGRPDRPEGLRLAIPNDDPDVLAAFGAPVGAPPPAIPLRCSPSDRARALGARGRCLPTGLAALDEATRGGPRVGSFGVLGGAPGAGKMCEHARGRGGARLLVWNATPDVERIHKVLHGGFYGEGVFRLEWRDARRRILHVERYAVGAAYQRKRRGTRSVPTPTDEPTPPALPRSAPRNAPRT